MHVRNVASGCSLCLSFLVGLMNPIQAAERQPVVVELFTSQGCSSCPPANANLIKLSQQPGVLALSFSVTYWDYLGWKDVFGKPEFTNRQAVYEPGLGQPGPFTPQMVVNGHFSTVGASLGDVESLIAKAAGDAGPEIALSAGKLTIGQGRAPAEGADVWLVQYDANIVNVPVARGENTGRTLPHTRVVHSLSRLSDWNGQALALAIPPAPAGLRTAILVQTHNGGPILAAATDR
ncbi:MAG: DUF1223 domain-containing protein [Beijerinckiaceae bacterium]